MAPPPLAFFPIRRIHRPASIIEIVQGYRDVPKATHQKPAAAYKVLYLNGSIFQYRLLLRILFLCDILTHQDAAFFILTYILNIYAIPIFVSPHPPTTPRFYISKSMRLLILLKPDGRMLGLLELFLAIL